MRMQQLFEKYQLGSVKAKPERAEKYFSSR